MPVMATGRNRGGVPTRAVLFDLDDTLFDHAHATRRALAGLRALDSALGAWELDALFERHSRVLEDLHRRVLSGELTVDDARHERFQRLLVEAAGGRESGDVRDRAASLARRYRAAYEDDWRPVPGALALLEAVRRAGLRAVVVTNNGVAEQRRKLERCGIGDWIDGMVTSEEAGVSKPAPEIFDIALRLAGAEPANAVMVGDAWATDIAGALGSGIRPVWFNRWRLARPVPGAGEVEPLVAELHALEPAGEAFSVVSRPNPPGQAFDVGAAWDRV